MTTRSERTAKLVEQIAGVHARLLNERGPRSRVGDEAALTRGRAAFLKSNEHLFDASPVELRDLLAKEERKLDALREAQRAQAAGEPVAGWSAVIGEVVAEVEVPGGGRAWLASGPAVITDPEVPFGVAVTLGVEGGEVGVTEVAFRRRPGGDRLAARSIRSQPVGRVIAEAVRLLTVEDGHWRAPTVAASAEVRRAMRQSMKAGPVGQAGQQPLSDDDLRFIAEAYRAAPRRGKRAAVEYEIEMHRPGLDARVWATGEKAAVNRYNYRRKAAMNRIDPETGRPFLP